MIGVTIAGGGTGGHLFPGLAVAGELARRGAAVNWLGARRGLEATRVPAAGIPISLLPVTGAVGRSPAAQLGAVCRTAAAVAAAYAALERTGSQAVLAVGGYAALSGGTAARLLRIPLVVQEQNARPGLTNRILAPWAAAIPCGFREGSLSLAAWQAVWTGNPVRIDFFSTAPPPAGPPTLLVLGGSQGSLFLNRLVPAALAALPADQRPAVLHQAGPRWAEEVARDYRERGVAAEVTTFLEQPATAVLRCTLAVARAGALTVSELAAAGRPAVLVPLAVAAHDHQSANARALAATGAAVVLPEAEASPGRLTSLLAELLADPASLLRRGVLGRALARPDAATRIADLVLAAARGEVPGRAMEAGPMEFSGGER